MAEKKTSGAPTATKKPHQKVEAKTAIAEQGKQGKGQEKYSVESLRANMSTGGGEPIPAGHKWTNERRRLQPRDPDTGHFTYNADAQYGLKYKSHGKKEADPIALKRFGFGDGIKAGEKIAINDNVWIAIKDMDAEKLRRYFTHYDEELEDYYDLDESERTPSEIHDLPTETEKIMEETKLMHDLHGVTFSSNFIGKRGRRSKEEIKGMEEGKTHLGEVDLAKLGKYSKDEMQKKLQEQIDGMTPSDKVTMEDSVITLDHYKEDKKYNEEKDARGWVAGRPFHRGYWRISPSASSIFGGGSPSTPKPATTGPAPTTPAKPATTGPAPSTPAPETASEPKVETEKSKKVRETFGDISEASSNPGKYLHDHKDMLTSLQGALKDAGVETSLEDLVTTISRMTEDQLADLFAE